MFALATPTLTLFNPQGSLPLLSFTHFIDVRHYEVFSLDSFLRQVEAQNHQYIRYYNHYYYHD